MFSLFSRMIDHCHYNRTASLIDKNEILREERKKLLADKNDSIQFIERLSQLLRSRKIVPICGFKRCHNGIGHAAETKEVIFFCESSNPRYHQFTEEESMRQTHLTATYYSGPMYCIVQGPIDLYQGRTVINITPISSREDIKCHQNKVLRLEEQISAIDKQIAKNQQKMREQKNR